MIPINCQNPTFAGVSTTGGACGVSSTGVLGPSTGGVVGAGSGAGTVGAVG